MRIQKVIGLLVVSVCLTATSVAQSDTLMLSTQDSVLLANMHALLDLTPFQSNYIDSLIKKDSGEILRLEREHQRLARSEGQNAERDARLTELRDKKKSLKEMRELNIKLLLNPQQLAIYNEKIKPGVPSVIHMGMNHDRAKCTVCIPK